MPLMIQRNRHTRISPTASGLVILATVQISLLWKTYPLKTKEPFPTSTCLTIPQLPSHNSSIHHLLPQPCRAAKPTTSTTLLLPMVCSKSCPTAMVSFVQVTITTFLPLTMSMCRTNSSSGMDLRPVTSFYVMYAPHMRERNISH